MPSPDLANPAAGYAAATESLRSATRWLLAAAAAELGALAPGCSSRASVPSTKPTGQTRRRYRRSGHRLRRCRLHDLAYCKLLAGEWITLAAAARAFHPQAQ